MELLPQSVQSLGSSQQDLEAPRSVPNGFYTSQHNTEGERGDREAVQMPTPKGMNFLRFYTQGRTCCNEV